MNCECHWLDAIIKAFVVTNMLFLASSAICFSLYFHRRLPFGHSFSVSDLTLAHPATVEFTSSHDQIWEKMTPLT